jgi:hypothetical protein
MGAAWSWSGNVSGSRFRFCCQKYLQCDPVHVSNPIGIQFLLEKIIKNKQ